jgi:hypothetical protein
VDEPIALLRQATITFQRIGLIGGECCVGNAGQYLLKQAAGFTIDFSAMTLRLSNEALMNTRRIS